MSGYLGFGSLKELIEELTCQDMEFYYDDVKYMFSTEWIGPRKHQTEKKCLSYQNGTYEEYIATLQAYDSWDELFEKAYFQDGVKVKDVIADL